MTIKWNPNFERDLKREIVKNMTSTYRTALARVTCPDHQKHPNIEAHGEEWRIAACCDKAKEMALEAIREANAG